MSSVADGFNLSPESKSQVDIDAFDLSKIGVQLVAIIVCTTLYMKKWKSTKNTLLSKIIQLGSKKLRRRRSFSCEWLPDIQDKF